MKIRFATIGTSNITIEFLKAAKLHKDFTLSCVYSRDIKKAQEFANTHNATFYFDDLDEMASSDKFDAIYIASPNSLHYEQVIKFLKTKKHVLCEKAFALTNKQAIEMQKCAKENNVVLEEAMRSTTVPGFIKAKKNLYKLGTIRRYFASFCQYSSRYDAYKETGIIPNIFNKKMGAGSLMDIGVYCIAPAVNLFGIPSSINATSTMLDSGVDGQGSAILSYNGFDAVIMHSKIANSHCGVEIQGELGTLISDNIRFSNVKIIYKDGTTETLYTETIENDMYYEIADFIETIQNDKSESNLNPLENSINTVKILEEICNIIGLNLG